MNKNLGLSPEEFDQLVADLKKNETRFFKKIFLQYFKDFMALLQKHYNASEDDAYDATMDALIEFRRRLVEGKLKYGNLRYLFSTMTHQHYVRNKKAFQSQDLEEEGFEPPYAFENKDETVELVNYAWIRLDKDCQELMKLHIYGRMKLTDIADLMDRSPAAVRKQKERCIAKIKMILLNKKEKK